MKKILIRFAILWVFLLVVRLLIWDVHYNVTVNGLPTRVGLNSWTGRGRWSNKDSSGWAKLKYDWIDININRPFASWKLDLYEGDIIHASPFATTPDTSPYNVKWKEAFRRVDLSSGYYGGPLPPPGGKEKKMYRPFIKHPFIQWEIP